MFEFLISIVIGIIIAITAVFINDLLFILLVNLLFKINKINAKLTFKIITIKYEKDIPRIINCIKLAGLIIFVIHLIIFACIFTLYLLLNNGNILLEILLIISSMNLFVIIIETYNLQTFLKVRNETQKDDN